MGNCKCGRQLKDGEKLCPLCNSKKDANTKRFSLGAVAFAVLGVGLDLALNKGKISKGTIGKIKDIFK